MRSNVQIIVFSVLLLVVTAVARPANAGGSDARWDAAVALYDRSMNLVPGTMIMNTEIKKKDGEISDRSSMDIRVFQSDTGDVQTEILKAVENGYDVTGKARDAAEKDADNESSDSGESASFSISAEVNPFAPGCQDRVTVECLNREEQISGLTAMVYRFTFTPTEKEILKGTAWLEKETGRVLKVESVPEPLPAHVKEMTTTDWYDLDPDGRLVLVRSEVSGRGGILFIQRWFTTRMEFRDHWVYSDPKPESTPVP